MNNLLLPFLLNLEEGLSVIAKIYLPEKTISLVNKSPLPISS